MWLPVAEAGKDVSAATPKPEQTKTDDIGATVLLVDDEMMVRRIGTALLERSGMRVLEAEDGRQALELFEHHGRDIDLMILDYAMPDMSGATVFDVVRSKIPDMPVIVSSGYANLADIDNMIAQGAGFVQKPFRLHELLSVVRSALGRPDTLT